MPTAAMSHIEWATKLNENVWPLGNTKSIWYHRFNLFLGKKIVKDYSETKNHIIVYSNQEQYYKIALSFNFCLFRITIIYAELELPAPNPIDLKSKINIFKSIK